MPAISDGGYLYTPEDSDGDASGLLEDPKGVVHLRRNGREAATLVTTTVTKDHTHEGVTWNVWRAKRLYWSHTSGLLFLQGASLQLLLSPFLLLGGRPTRVADPRPGMHGVTLVDIVSAPPAATYSELFQLIADRLVP